MSQRFSCEKQRTKCSVDGFLVQIHKLTYAKSPSDYIRAGSTLFNCFMTLDFCRYIHVHTFQSLSVAPSYFWMLLIKASLFFNLNAPLLIIVKNFKVKIYWVSVIVNKLAYLWDTYSWKRVVLTMNCICDNVNLSKYICQISFVVLIDLR